MNRFFFDYATQGQSLYDHRGDEFRNLDAAVRHAAIIAENLQFTSNNRWTGWWIEGAQRTRSEAVDHAGP